VKSKENINTSETDSVPNADSLVKYIQYLLDYADSIYSVDTISENNYISLQNEINYFHKKINNSGKIPHSIKSKLLQIKLSKSDKNSPSLGIL